MGILLFIALIIIAIIVAVALLKDKQNTLLQTVAICCTVMMLYVIAGHITYAVFSIDAPSRTEKLDIVTLGESTFYVRETEKGYMYCINEELVEMPKANVTLRVKGPDQIPQIKISETEIEKNFWTSGWIIKPEMKKEVIIEVPGGFVDYNE